MVVMVEISHPKGVPWWKAPVPSRVHRCEVWTTGVVPRLGLVERCACGAIRLDGTPPWMERNQRKNSPPEPAPAAGIRTRIRTIVDWIKS